MPNFVSSADLLDNGGTTNSLSASFTCAGGTNNVLAVAFAGDDTTTNFDDITGVTYNSVAMTLAAKVSAAAVGSHGYSGRWLYVYLLRNPPAGSHTVSISCTNNHWLIALAAEYSNVGGIGNTSPSSFFSNFDITSFTSALTVNAGSWVLAAGWSASVSSTGTNTTIRVTSAIYEQPAIFDTNAALSAGSNNITINFAAANPIEMVLVELQPVVVEAPNVTGRYRTPVYARPRVSWDTAPTLPPQGPLAANPHFIGRYRVTPYAYPKTLIQRGSESQLPLQVEAQPHFIARYQQGRYQRPRTSEDVTPYTPPQVEAQPHFATRYKTSIYARPRLSEDAATTLPPQIEAQPHFATRYKTSIYARPRLSEDAATTLPPQIEAPPHFTGRYRTPIYARPRLSEDAATTLLTGPHVQSAFSTFNNPSGQSSFSVTVNPLGVGNIVTGAAILVLDTGTAAPAVSITDNAGNTYTQLDNPTNGVGRFLLSFALKIPPGGGGGTSITCTVGGGVTVGSTQIFLDEWSGFDHVGDHSGANSNNVDPATTSAITSVNPNALFWGGFFNSAGVDTPAPGSGFTGLIDANDGNWNPRTEYLIQATPGSTAVTAANSAADFVTIVGIVLEATAVLETQPHFIGRYRTPIYVRPRTSEDPTPYTPPPVFEAQPHFIGRYRTPIYARPKVSEDAATTLLPQVEAPPHFVGRYRTPIYVRPRTSEDPTPYTPPQIEAQPHFVGRYRTPIYARPRLSEDAATTLPPQIEAQPHFIGRYRTSVYVRLRTSEDPTLFTPPLSLEAQPHFIGRYRTSIYTRPRTSGDAAATLSKQIEAQPHFVGRYKSAPYRWLSHFHAETDTSSSLGQHVQSAFSTANDVAGQTSFSVTVNPLGVGNIVVGAIILILDTGTSPSLVITDNAGIPNTYTQLDNPNNGAGRFLVSFALKIPPGRGGATLITCTVGGGLTVNSTQIFLDEWSGFDHVGSHAGANSSTVNPVTTGPITSVNLNALFWGGFFNSSGFDNVLPGLGFAGLIDVNDANWNPRSEYLAQPAPGPAAVTASNPAADFVTIVGVVLETAPPAAAETQPHFIGRYRTSIFARPKLSEDAAATLPPQVEAQPHFITRYRTVPYLKPVLIWDTSLTLPPQGPLEVQPHFISRYRLTRYIRPRTSEETLPLGQREAQPHFIGRYRTFIYARLRLSEDAATTLPRQIEVQPHFIGRYRVASFWRVRGLEEEATGLSFVPPPPPPPAITVAKRVYEFEYNQLVSFYNTGQLTVQQFYYALYALQWYFSGATDWNTSFRPRAFSGDPPAIPIGAFPPTQMITNQADTVVDAATLINTARALRALGCPPRAFPAPYPPRWAFQFYGGR